MSSQQLVEAVPARTAVDWKYWTEPELRALPEFAAITPDRPRSPLPSCWPQLAIDDPTILAQIRG